MVGDRAGSGETNHDGEDLSGHHTSLRIPQSPIGRRGRNRGSKAVTGRGKNQGWVQPASSRAATWRITRRPASLSLRHGRSEERRVGEGGRSGQGPDEKQTNSVMDEKTKG